MNHNLNDWLNEADTPAAAANPDQTGSMAPQVGVSGGGPGMDPNQKTDPNITNQPDQMNPQPQDMSQDPGVPDMPQQDDGEGDFEVWKKEYFKESVKGDVLKQKELLKQFKYKDDLLPAQRVFVDNNWDIQLLRENSNINKVSKEVRKTAREQMDRNNPANTMVNILHTVLQTDPMLNNIFIKCLGYGDLKSGLHRKYMAALVNAVQVGHGGNDPDLIYNEKGTEKDKGYSIMISTRMGSTWNRIVLGDWSLKEDDAERFLKEPEIKRLNEGSPEEKDVLRRRIVMESIASQFKTRAFLVTVVSEDGTIYNLGWDIANSLRNAYTDGKLVVRTRRSDNSEALIDDEGRILPFMDLSINYLKETGEQDEEGFPATDEIRFMERKNGMLMLVANLNTVKEAAATLSGFSLKETPYAGNPSDLKMLRTCVYSAHDLLMKQC
jgi:hypothetical protein